MMAAGRESRASSAPMPELAPVMRICDMGVPRDGPFYSSFI